MTESNPPRFTPQGLIRTPEQTAIQLAQNKVVLIDANAGAAKTTTLALRIGEALARKLPPEQILALVFTPEARDVMRQRLLDIGIPYAAASRVDVATFEDFAARMLAQSGSGAAERLPQARQLKPYVLHALERVSERYTGQVEYLDIRTHNIALSQFLDFQLTLKATMALDADLEYMELEEAAELLKVPLTDYLATREYETMRLGGDDGAQFRGPFDATYDLACQLSQSAESAQALPGYRVVVCDELHDLNEAAFRILNALLARPDCYFVGAGDKDQVIYTKLGASQEFLEHRFARLYPSLKHYPLTYTYRHGPHLAYAMQEFKNKPVESSLPLHTEIRQLHYTDADGCGEQVIAAIKAWKRDGYPLEGCAILLRDRHQSIAVENALLKAKIGYRTPAMAGYLQRDEILFLRGMLAIALRDLEAVKSLEVRAAMVEALAVFGEVQLAPERLEMAKREVARTPSLLGDFYTLYINGGDGYGDPARSAGGSVMAAAIQYAAGLDPAVNAAEALRAICGQINLEQAAKRIFVRPYEASVVSKSVAGFIAFAEHSGQTLAEFWQTLNAAEAFASRKREKDYVTLDCAGNAKGKEFEHVILPFLEAGEFPSPMFAGGEEENLFYVAATRAKARLTLLSPSEAAQRSPYLARMRLAATAAAAEQAINRNSEAVQQQIPARYYLSATIHEAQQVKALGAKFDWSRKAWYVEPGVDLAPFSRWLRS
ncbi:ATP-dependent helicase [Pseudoduganella aquatica]|uniref:ATP-dependent helicase n=1 Tax=Pseudoduganella aquatica TaxID=2660641 RepID=UPI001E4F8B5A|nr:ATP-dependent helicase [Pseudoduganella aquatica]